MRGVLLALSLAAATLAVPAPAQAATVCDWDDVQCIAECLAFTGGPCGVRNPPPLLDTAPCDAGELGQVLIVLGTPVSVCVSVGTGPCPEGFTGLVVFVNGQPHGVCVQ